MTQSDDREPPDPKLVRAFRRAAALQAFIDQKKREGWEVVVRLSDGHLYKIDTGSPPPASPTLH